MICKICVHFGLCALVLEDETITTSEYCHFFKDVSKFIELPYKVGDYRIDTNGAEVYIACKRSEFR